MGGVTDAWFDRELAGCRFADGRLNKRLRKLLERMDALPAGRVWPFVGEAGARIRSTISPTCSSASPTTRPGTSPIFFPGTGNPSSLPALPPELASSPSAYR
jgi:Transposase DNA-binding